MESKKIDLTGRLKRVIKKDGHFVRKAVFELTDADFKLVMSPMSVIIINQFYYRPVLLRYSNYSSECEIHFEPEAYTFSGAINYPMSAINNNQKQTEMKNLTKEEKKEALINEAKMRGFVEGVFVKGFDDSGQGKISGTFFNNGNKNRMWSNRKGSASLGIEIFRDGKWAEIISNPVQDQIEKLEAELEKLKKLV